MHGHGHGSGKRDPIQGKIESRQLEERKVFLWGAVHDESARRIVERLIYLNDQDPEKDITFYVNSPGGVITSGMAIIDTMHMIKADVSTVVMGLAASMGALILSQGVKGKRFAWPNARVMIHQPLISGQIVAPAMDLKIHAEEIRKTRNELNRMLADASDKTVEQLEADTDRDNFLSAQESLDYGLIDAIVQKGGI